MGLDEPQRVYSTILTRYSSSARRIRLLQLYSATLDRTSHSICVCSLLCLPSLLLLSAFLSPYRFLCPYPPRHHHASFVLLLLTPVIPPLAPPLPPAFAPSSSSSTPLPDPALIPILWYALPKKTHGPHGVLCPQTTLIPMLSADPPRPWAHFHIISMFSETEHGPPGCCSSSIICHSLRVQPSSRLCPQFSHRISTVHFPSSFLFFFFHPQALSRPPSPPSRVYKPRPAAMSDIKDLKESKGDHQSITQDDVCSHSVASPPPLRERHRPLNPSITSTDCPL